MWVLSDRTTLMATKRNVARTQCQPPRSKQTLSSAVGLSSALTAEGEQADAAAT